MQLRPSVAHYAFDSATFDELRSKVGSGTLDPAANRLPEAPEPLSAPPTDLRDGGEADREQRAALEQAGRDALRDGKVAILVLNGGMATRFGGGAKGVVSVATGHPRVSFLAIKLAEAVKRSQEVDGSIPVVVMNSFATEDTSLAHLNEIDWSGVPDSQRHTFAQSIMPRVLPDGTPLASLPEAAELDDAALYAAPGHGDTLGRLRDSGVLGRLIDHGVEHVLVSNVDNVGASLDPFVLGAHLRAVAQGARVSVEVVRRQEGDAGGCIAQLPRTGRPAIIESFRLPEGTSLAQYPHFNSNTLWLTTQGVDRDLALTWFAVRKSIEWPAGERAPEGKLEVVQFERLIGQVTEFADSAYLEVERDTRFLPIKTRDDLDEARPDLEAFARSVHLVR